MNKHIEDFRKAVTAGTPVEALAGIYGLSKGPGETDAELSSRLEMLLEAAPLERPKHSQECALRYMSDEDAKARDYGCTCRRGR